jgi:hypothetical protein
MTIMCVMWLCVYFVVLSYRSSFHIPKVADLMFETALSEG